MSLEDIQVVDAVGTAKDGSSISLFLLDSWDWEDPHQHLYSLQEKINAYLSFVESGQIYEDYPAAEGKRVQIDIMSRFPMPKEGLAFVEAAAAIASRINIVITQRVV
jgi:hypothetical protein